MTETDINALGLIDEELPEVAVGDLPERGGFDLVQPGFYTFKLPASDLIVSSVKAVQSQAGQRIQVYFGRHKEENFNSSLRIPSLGKVFATSVSNVEREIQGVKESDLAHLLQALGVKGSLKTNKEYVETLAALGENEFQAEVAWGASCNTARDIYGEDGKPVAGKKGCGQDYALRSFERKSGKKVGQKVLAIPQEDGRYAERFVCATPGCGAVIRAFGKLRTFRPSR
jgi:hypothetical protein